MAYEWEHESLKDVNIGEEIALVRLWDNDIKLYYIVKIVGKTATGSLKTEDGDLIKLESNWSRNREQYCKVTNEILERIELQNKAKELSKKVATKSFYNATMEEINVILKIVDDMNERKNKK